VAERPVSPYLAPGFYDTALAKGRHRDIVGGRWDETGRVQMAALLREGLRPDDRLLDIGAGSLRLGCKAVPYLDPGNYWATDASGALMARGHQLELADPTRLSGDHLIEDADFAFPGIPDSIDMAICFAVFTHLPADCLPPALTRIRAACPGTWWARSRRVGLSTTWWALTCRGCCGRRSSPSCLPDASRARR